YLVCNADESEPGTFKDRELMQKNPHLLIEGIIIGAYCIGANKSFIFIRGEYDYVADILDAAVAEARTAGYLGENILGSTHDIDGGPLDGRSFKAFFPGGSSAPVLPLTDEVLDLAYDFDSLAKAGSMLGSGAVIVFDDSTSIVDVAYKTAHFYRHESCGKCS